VFSSNPRVGLIARRRWRGLAPVRRKRCRADRRWWRGELRRWESGSREHPICPVSPTVIAPRNDARPDAHSSGSRHSPASYDKVYAIAEQQGWLVGQTIERALEALERELRGGGQGA